MKNSIKDFFNSLTAIEQEEKYLKLNGYPKENITFADKYGRVTQLIGSDTIMEEYNKLKEILW